MKKSIFVSVLLASFVLLVSFVNAISTVSVDTSKVEAWAQGPSFFTIGKTELVNVYVKFGDTSVYKNTSLTILSSDMPVSLPESNNSIFLVTVIILAGCIYYFSRLSRSEW